MEISKKSILDQILQIVSEETKVTVLELKSQNRSRKVSDARKVFCYAACTQNVLHMTLKEVGLSIGNRSHSTVLHNITCTGHLMDQDMKFLSVVEKVKMRLTYHNLVDSLNFNAIPQL